MRPLVASMLVAAGCVSAEPRIAVPDLGARRSTLTVDIVSQPVLSQTVTSQEPVTFEVSGGSPPYSVFSTFPLQIMADQDAGLFAFAAPLTDATFDVLLIFGDTAGHSSCVLATVNP